MIKIAILFYVSKDFGYGHLYRTTRLARVLSSKYMVNLICNKNADAVRYAERNNLKIHIYEDSAIEIIKEIYPDILIIDRLDNELSTIKEIKKLAKKLIIIDDKGDAAAEADMLINPIIPLPELRPSRAYHGIHYMIFSDELEKLAEQGTQANRAENRGYNNVFMAFGGSDPNNISELMIPIIAKNPETYFELVLGPGYQNMDSFINKYSAINNLTIYYDLADLSKLMLKSDLCVVSGGLTLFECVFLHKKTVVACQVEHQIVNADNLSSVASIINLGIISKNRTEKLSLLENIIKGKVEFPTRKGVELKNGKYVIAELIDELAEELKCETLI